MNRLDRPILCGVLLLTAQHSLISQVHQHNISRTTDPAERKSRSHWRFR